MLDSFLRLNVIVVAYSKMLSAERRSWRTASLPLPIKLIDLTSTNLPSSTRQRHFQRQVCTTASSQWELYSGVLDCSVLQNKRINNSLLFSKPQDIASRKFFPDSRKTRKLCILCRITQQMWRSHCDHQICYMSSQMSVCSFVLNF